MSLEEEAPYTADSLELVAEAYPPPFPSHPNWTSHNSQADAVVEKSSKHRPTMASVLAPAKSLNEIVIVCLEPVRPLTV